jgi:hypothetical protein
MCAELQLQTLEMFWARHLLNIWHVCRFTDAETRNNLGRSTCLDEHFDTFTELQLQILNKSLGAVPSEAWIMWGFNLMSDKVFLDKPSHANASIHWYIAATTPICGVALRGTHKQTLKHPFIQTHTQTHTWPTLAAMSTWSRSSSTLS